MEAFMNSITDKPGWQGKIFDEDIKSRWRQEALGQYSFMTSRMIDWVSDLSDSSRRSYSPWFQISNPISEDVPAFRE
jgi:Protein of unknown function (DUF4246)